MFFHSLGPTVITAKKHPLTEYLLGRYFLRKVRRSFSRVLLKHEENISFADLETPLILYANHPGWWDGVLPFLLTSVHLGLDGYAMMEEAQMQRYGFFRRIGCFSVDRESPRDSLLSLRYAASLLRARNRLLWIFPQGEIVHVEQRPLHLYRGLAWLMKELERVTVVPVALRYELGRQERPEAWIHCGTPWTVSPAERVDMDIAQYYLGRLLEDLMNQQRSDVMNEARDGYRVWIQGRTSVNERWDRARGVS